MVINIIQFQLNLLQLIGMITLLYQSIYNGMITSVYETISICDDAEEIHGFGF